MTIVGQADKAAADCRFDVCDGSQAAAAFLREHAKPAMPK